MAKTKKTKAMERVPLPPDFIKGTSFELEGDVDVIRLNPSEILIRHEHYYKSLDKECYKLLDDELEKYKKMYSDATKWVATAPWVDKKGKPAVIAKNQLTGKEW